MKAKVLKRFFDKEDKKVREEKEEFEVKKERFDKLKQLGFVELKWEEDNNGKVSKFNG